MKKSLSILFSSLILCGLLLVGNANALKYTVNGDTTVKIPQSPTDDDMEIDWGDETDTRITSCTSENLADGARGYKCNHEYNDNLISHTITIINPNNLDVESLYISEGNVASIEDFDGFLKITQLYISNNKISSLPQNIFNLFSKDVYIHANENLLTDFQPNLSKINNLYLNDNKLTTIPQNIWNARGTHKIHLTDNVKIGNNTRGNVYLNNETPGEEPDNKINFIGITKIDSTDDIDYIDGSRTYEFSESPYNGYHFERFGYSYNTESIVYKYQVLKDGIIVDETVGTGNSTGTNIPQILAPGNYTFKVCYNEENDNNNSEHCDEVNFAVDYDENITISSPQNNQEYDSLNNIPGERGRTGNYPKSLLSGYSYIITKGSQTIKEGFIDINDTNESCTYHDCVNWIDIGNIIETELGGNNPNDEYGLTIYLIDKDGNIAQANNHNIYATSTFSINIISEPVTVNITQPASEESTQTITFERNHIFPSSPYHTYDFQYYEYTVKKGSTTITGNNNTNNTGFKLEDLEDGAYTFEVIMHYADNSENKIATGTKTFTMTASEAPHVSITSPTTSSISASNVITTGVNFSWICGATISHNCEYNLIDNSNPTSPIKEGVGDNGQFTQDLGNGNYTFTVNLYDSTHNLLTGDSVSFTISIPTTLTISSPISGSSTSYATTTFSWEGFTPYTLNYYEYSVTGPLYSTGNNNTNDTGFQLHNLRDGEYTFTVQMHYNDGTDKSKTESSKFTVNASAGASLTITSPTNSKTYTGEYSKTVPIDFTWEGGGSDLVSKYSYKLTNTLTNEEITGTVNKNIEGVYSIPRKDLPSGTYKFEVMMLDSENELIIPAETHIFNIIIPPHLDIITPVQNSNFSGQQNINFLRSGFSEFDDQCYYEWSLRKTKNNTTTTTTGKILNMVNMEATGLQLNLSNGIYDFTVRIMSGDSEIISKSHSFSILDSIDLQIYVSDGNTSVTTLTSDTGAFIWNGESEDFYKYNYSISSLSSGNAYIYSGESFSKTGILSLNGLTSGRYRFEVIMLRSNDTVITGKYVDFDVKRSAWIKIISPISGDTINSSSALFQWTGYSDVITRYEYNLVKVGGNVDTNNFTSLTSFSRSDLSDGNYSLTVWISSGGSLVASDSISFVVVLPKKIPSGGGGGGGGGSSKSNTSTNTNNLSVLITNKNPDINGRIGVEVDVDKKYTGKVDFTRIQYNSDGKWIDFKIPSDGYVSDYSDEAKRGYVKFSSSDNGKIELSKFIKLSQSGKYRIYVKDEDGHTDYVQFSVGNPEDEEVYISRSCKKYVIRYNSDLGVYTSPDLLRNEYFISKDYFKRYIDSKNKQVEGCPKNRWVSVRYNDASNSSDRYVAPNGKVYFIVGQSGKFYSDELNHELKAPASFLTIKELKDYIMGRNPLTPILDNGTLNMGNKVSINVNVTTGKNDKSNGYNSEFNNAYNFARKAGITTMESIEGANMNGNLTRIAMAKMLSNYAVNVLGTLKFREDTPKFSDVSQKLNDDYGGAVTLAYQLGIMGQNMPDGRFRPNDMVTRAEFATALSRMLYSTSDGNPYYSTHLQKLYNEGIITNTNPNLYELRGYVMLMLMRSANK